MEDFEQFLATIENVEHRTRLGEVLEWVRNRFPDMECKIAWNQPMFTDHGTFIIGFSTSKQHFSVAPESKGIDEFAEEIAKSGYSRGSNLFRIRWDEPVDFSLLERIIIYNQRDKAECSSFWRKKL